MEEVLWVGRYLFVSFGARTLGFASPKCEVEEGGGGATDARVI